MAAIHALEAGNGTATVRVDRRSRTTDVLHVAHEQGRHRQDADEDAVRRHAGAVVLSLLLGIRRTRREGGPGTLSGARRRPRGLAVHTACDGVDFRATRLYRLAAIPGDGHADGAGSCSARYSAPCARSHLTISGSLWYVAY